jgi:hypothetical protein
MDVQEKGCRQREVSHWNDCGGIPWSAGRPDKPVPRCDNPSGCLATRNVVRPAALLPLCLGETDRGRTGTLEALRDLRRTAEVSLQTCRCIWRLRRREFAASRSIVPYLTPAVLEVRRRPSCPVAKCVSRPWRIVLRSPGC